MSWPLPWWAYLLIWWAGMIPGAMWAGRVAKRQAQKAEGNPFTETQIAIFVMAWPVWVALAPIAAAYTAARKAKADGKSKR